jgi:hypothetical protein
MSGVAATLVADLNRKLEVLAVEALRRGCGLVIVRQPLQISDDLTSVTASVDAMVSHLVPARQTYEFRDRAAFDAWLERQP